MAENSNIEWCHHTQNFWWGCEKVSPGCKFCYAETLSKRFDEKSKLWRGERRRIKDWSGPLRWNKQAKASGQRFRVFTNSMADFFEDHSEPNAWRGEAWDLIRKCDALDWLILTKRPENIPAMLPADWGAGWPNVWLGASCENQEYADKRIPHLIEVPAAIRFLSLEPLLGRIYLGPRCFNGADGGITRGIHWVIIGGESGKGARGCRVEWIQSVVDQCRFASVPVFVKQLGSWPIGFGQLRDKKGGDMAEWPENLRIREFPR